MIKELKIRNFQSHKNTTLNFDPGVNVIVGATDVGKSAIIRALRWVVWNRPSGDSFRSNWDGTTKVGVLTDSHGVVRIKSDSENKYVLNDSEDSKEFKALGTGVPDEINNALSLNEVNLQQQHDKPFLLSDTPGQIASFFNKVAGIDLIDKGIKNVQKEIRSTTKEIEVLSTVLSDKKKDLKTFIDTEKIENEIVVLEKLEQKLSSTISDHNKLADLFEKLEDIELKMEESNHILKLESKVNGVLKNIEKRNSVQEKLYKLKTLILSIGDKDKKIKSTRKLINSGKVIDTITQKIARKTALQAQIGTLSGLLGKYMVNTTNTAKLQVEIATKQKLFDSNMRICPLCGTKLK
jgi:exonuclease SbcC